jgi:hypothetical protein
MRSERRLPAVATTLFANTNTKGLVGHSSTIHMGLVGASTADNSLMVWDV